MRELLKIWDNYLKKLVKKKKGDYEERSEIIYVWIWNKYHELFLELSKDDQYEGFWKITHVYQFLVPLANRILKISFHQIKYS